MLELAFLLKNFFVSGFSPQIIRTTEEIFVWADHRVGSL